MKNMKNLRKRYMINFLCHTPAGITEEQHDAKKSGSTKSTSSINPTSQAQIASLLSSWLQINPNIQVSIE